MIKQKTENTLSHVFIRGKFTQWFYSATIKFNEDEMFSLCKKKRFIPLIEKYFSARNDKLRTDKNDFFKILFF